MRGGDAWMVEFNLGVDAWMLEFNLRGWMLGCLNFSDSNYTELFWSKKMGFNPKLKLRPRNTRPSATTHAHPL